VALVSRPRGSRPVILVGLLLVVLSSSLLLKAALVRPRGTVFAGTFYYRDDFYNYLSYVQQAEDGALVFRNKLAPPTAPPRLVNVEWLLVGWLSRLLGGHILVAYRVFGALAVLALVALVDRTLVRAGIPPSRRLFGLLLVFTGGGLGGLLTVLRLLPPQRAFDLRAGLYPFLEVVANPHFVAGTALLLAALLAFAEDRPVVGCALGTVLGLVRPYDLAILGFVAFSATLLLARPRDWPRRLLPLLGLLPIFAWNVWLFLLSPGFRAFSNPRYVTVAPTLLQLALALGPAALVSLAVLLRRPASEGEHRHRLYLALWAGGAFALGVLPLVSFSTQFLAGIGVPLLGLAAVGLSGMRRGVLETAVPLLAGSSVLIVVFVSGASPLWHVPASRWRAAERLRPLCRRGDVVLAPPDIGLYVGGLTACWPWVSHQAAPTFGARDRAARQFYADPSAERRSRFLAETGVRFVVFPVPAERGEGWSPEEAGFRRVDGGGPSDVAVFVREDGPRR
jgi:hypothetical protein